MSIEIDLSSDITIALSQVKEFLKIESITEDKKKLLKDLITDAQHETQLHLFPFADSLPLTGFLLTAVQKAQFFYVVSCYKQRQHLDKDAESYMKKFDQKMELIKTALTAVPTNRRRIVSASVDYDTEDSLFSQTLR